MKDEWRVVWGAREDCRTTEGLASERARQAGSLFLPPMKVSGMFWTITSFINLKSITFSNV